MRDTAALLDALTGPDPGAPYLAPNPSDDWMVCLADRPAGLRIGIVTDRSDGTPSDPVIVAAVETVAVQLAGLGHRIVNYAWPDIAEAAEAAAMLWQGEIAELVEARATLLGRPPAEDEIEPLSRRSWLAARGASVLDYLAAKAAQNRVSRRVAASFAAIDVLLLPTTATLPPAIGGLNAPGGFDYDYWTEAAYGFAPFSELFNLTGQPAISLPAAMSPEGLPIGIQLVGQFGADALLLALAQSLEDEIGWQHRRPSLAI